MCILKKGNNRVKLNRLDNYLIPPKNNKNKNKCMYVCVCVYIYIYIYIYDLFIIILQHMQAN